MSKVTVLNAEKKVFLYESTIAEELALAAAMDEELALHALTTVCGCLMMSVTEKVLEMIRQAAPSSPITEVGNYIVIIEEFTSTLTDEERRAVIAHEMGHVDHGHLEGRDGEGVVLQLQYELEADQAAVREVGAAAMASALVKLINRSHDIQLDYLAKNAGRYMQVFKSREVIEFSRTTVLNNDIIVKRLAALQ